MTVLIRYAAVNQLLAPLLLAGLFLEVPVYLLADEESHQDRKMSITKHKIMKIRDHSLNFFY